MSNRSAVMADAQRLLDPLDTKLKAQGYHLVYACVVGSHAYGTDTPDSDIDVRGVVTRCPKDILIGKDDESFQDHEHDVTIYTFDKFVRMLANGNPNIMDMMGVSPECILYQTDVSWKVYDNIHLFMSQSIASAYRGFGRSSLNQVLRLERYMDDNKKICKAMMHHIRTLNAGAQMLLTGKPCACATDVETLRFLRDGGGLDKYGAMTDRFLELSECAEEALSAALLVTSLPERADTEGIENLLAEVNADVLEITWEG